MAVVRGMELGRELTKTLSQIGQQIDVVNDAAQEEGISPYKMRNEHGDYLLSPLLAAKAQALHAIVLVNQRP